MNLLKTLTVALLAAALPGMAPASTNPTFIYISGSTAFRAPTTCAIISLLGGSNGNGCLAAANNSALLKGQSGIFANGTIVSYNATTNTNAGTATFIVETNWTGSLAGVLDVAAQNTNDVFPDPSDVTNVENNMAPCSNSPFGVATSGTGVLPYDVGTASPAYNTVNHAPNVCMSDSFATSAASVLASATITSGSIGGKTNGAGLKTLVTGAPLAEAGSSGNIVGAGTNSGYLGIVPFVWALGNLSNTDPISGPAGPATGFTNISQQTASFLTHAGYAPFTMFSKAATDTFSAGDFVYLIGRNEDSGTRIDGMAEPQPLTGFAINPNQWLPTFSGTNNTQDIPQPVLAGTKNIGGTSSSTTSVATWTGTTSTVTLSKPNSSILIGATVTGTGIAANTTVSDINGTTLTLSQNTTGSESGVTLTLAFAGCLIQNIAAWPSNDTLNTETTVTWNLSGHSGYPGGGDVESVLSTPVDENTTFNNDGAVAPGENTGNAFFIGYLGVSDAEGTTGTAKSGLGGILTYNGVAESTQTIDNGSYSFWSYEHMYYLKSGTGALSGSTSDGPLVSQLGFVTNLANGIAGTYAPYDSSGVIGDGLGGDNKDGAGVLLEAASSTAATTSGNVFRTIEGGPYSLNY